MPNKYYATSIVDEEIYEEFKRHLVKKGYKVKGFCSQLRQIYTLITERGMAKMIEDGDVFEVLETMKKHNLGVE